jgi:hypothetical protein
MGLLRLDSTNEESWAYVFECYAEYPDTPYWNQWRSTLVPLISRCAQAGYNQLFRAGTSMHDTVFSSLDHHRLWNEPRVLVSVTENWLIKIGHYNIHYYDSWPHFPAACRQIVTVAPSEAFPVLTRYLQHLWTETVSEPIPFELRRKD